MNPLELRLATKFLSMALERPCPELISRSSEAAAKVRCFAIYVDRKDGGPYLIVRSLSAGVLSCSEWTGTRFDRPMEAPLSGVASRDISITHFYGYNDVQYKGVFNFALGMTFKLPYLKIQVVRAIESTNQYFFNKKKLLTKQRIDLLRFMVQRQLNGQLSVSLVDLMTGLYSLKWIRHPDRDPQKKLLKFYLDSLVDIGELKYVEHRYQLTGEALKALEVYEEQERKHTENVKIQRGIFWLTAAIVLFTAAQAGLYKLPTLVDLSGAPVPQQAAVRDSV
ncbi:MAG: hypothetical protein ABI893_07925 [Polaromonas sp.]|uniref:hypothetical protein n=1 Tax=Polaromonas sp. TaxID=1869339 RepID=UPI003265CC85